MSITDKITNLKEELDGRATLVAVSKTQPVSFIREAYNAGQRIFAESRTQELMAKRAELPGDIEWHFIGGLQTNKVKYIAPFVSLIHSVDSEKLLNVIDREAGKNGRVIDILFEVHIARESTKQGWDGDELSKYLSSGRLDSLPNIRVRGLMGMASFVDNESVVEKEFTSLSAMFDDFRRKYFTGGAFDTLSMGMTGDWRTALRCGSNMVRIGSYIFGTR